MGWGRGKTYTSPIYNMSARELFSDPKTSKKEEKKEVKVEVDKKKIEEEQLRLEAELEEANKRHKEALRLSKGKKFELSHPIIADILRKGVYAKEQANKQETKTEPVKQEPPKQETKQEPLKQEPKQESIKQEPIRPADPVRPSPSAPIQIPKKTIRNGRFF